MTGDPLAVYIHTPFCPSKCGYCDFNSFALEGPIIERTVQAICSEISTSPHQGRPAKTVFIGGGTPTFLSGDQLSRILESALEAHPPVEGCEITSEANPGTLTLEKLQAMRTSGFNRISLGAQSFDDRDLKRLGRVHSAADIARGVELARQAGFDNLSLDLIFGLQGQEESHWQANLERALALKPDHLSLYGLTIEPNTRFHRYWRRGMMALPDDGAQAGMQQRAAATCRDAGFEWYEISNFAKPGRECAHNLAYWRAEEYAGYGPGAVGRVSADRQTKIKSPERYCDAVEGGAELFCEQESVGEGELRTERIMLGLRLSEGISSEDLEQGAISRLVEKGWAQEEGGRLALTDEGRLFHTSAVLELL